jgi:hypothetical protein
LLAVGRGTVAGDEPQAAPIPPDAKVTMEDVRPLQAEYFNFARIRPVGTPGIDSRDIAADFVSGRKPDAIAPLESTSIDFPPGFEGVVVAAQDSTLGEFLKGDDGDTEGPLAATMSSRNIFVFRGFIEVPQAGTFSFRIPADDGAEISIGGVVVHSHNQGGWYGPQNAGYMGRAEFSEAGIYPVEVLYWDKARDAGIEVYSDVNPAGEARDLGGGVSLVLLPVLTGPAGKASAN